LRAGHPCVAGGEQGAEETVAARLGELLDSGLSELLLTVVPAGDAAANMTRLFQLVGQL
jgi:hypothetical protein